MPGQIKGIVKGCKVPGSSKSGYRPVWDMGKAAINKKRSKTSGPDRPST